MPRLESTVKGGYYPIISSALPPIASLFTPATQGGKILDPCAGEGDALQHLSAAWNLTPYANELDHDRAAACRWTIRPTASRYHRARFGNR